MVMLNTLNITASDVTGQKRVSARDVPRDSSVGELLDGLVPSMNLGRRGSVGDDLQVEARLEREGRHLHRSEIVGEALRDEDHIVLHPRIMAGGSKAGC